MNPLAPTPVTRRAYWIGAAILVAYAIVRLATLPSNPRDINGYSHDGAYLTIVAQNLVSGRGFVLDALWMVFLQPASLPMPYHNANPLHPLAMAAVMKASGADAILAGYVLSALASAGLAFAAWFLLRKYAPPWPAFGIGCMVALFPPAWALSWSNMTDELWIALMVAGIAAMLRSERWSMAIWSGVFFGLAWLTRSAASSAIPSVILWMILALGWRKALPRFAALAGVAVAICSPWLIYTAHVWGSPLRSDVGLVASSHLEAKRYDDMTIRVFHEPTPPRSLTVIAREDPVGFVKRVIKGVRPVMISMISDAASMNRIAAIVLLLLAAAALAWRPRSALSPEALALLLYLLVFGGFLTLAGRWAEGRYFLLIHVLVASWLFWTAWQAAADFSRGGRSAAGLAVLALTAVFLAFAARADYRLATFYRDVNPENKEYFAAAQRFDREVAHGATVVVGDHPYFYTITTGAHSACIPQASDDYLFEYMEKYQARYVFLTDFERGFWRPQWASAEAVPSRLRRVASPSGFVAYELTSR